MEFDSLMFDQVGCCADHPRAVLVHANGLRTEVQPDESGWRVSTFCGGTLVVGMQHFASREGVEQRLTLDAALRG